MQAILVFEGVLTTTTTAIKMLSKLKFIIFG